MPVTITPASEGISIVTLSLPSGVAVRILTIGASLQSIIVPDREGVLDDVLLGFDDPADYLRHRKFFGATVGRFANRIAGGRFRSFQIPQNGPPNSLHGGPEGLDRHNWTIDASGDDWVRLATFSPDGDQGFPGNLNASVTYRLTEGTTLSVVWEATTDVETPVNLTNHAFFNLGGATSQRDTMGHHLSVNAARYLPVDPTGIPEGDPAPVKGTAFDFRIPRPIGSMIRADDDQLRRRQGYDHNFCLDGQDACTLHDPVSGRRMALWTDQPGVQVYSGNFLNGTLAGKGGLAPRMGDAVCLEPQGWPDSPNRPDFPSPYIPAGGTYRHEMRLTFTAE